MYLFKNRIKYILLTISWTVCCKSSYGWASCNSCVARHSEH